MCLCFCLLRIITVTKWSHRVSFFLQMAFANGEHATQRRGTRIFSWFLIVRRVCVCRGRGRGHNWLSRVARICLVIFPFHMKSETCRNCTRSTTAECVDCTFIFIFFRVRFSALVYSFNTKWLSIWKFFESFVSFPERCVSRQSGPTLCVCVCLCSYTSCACCFYLCSSSVLSLFIRGFYRVAVVHCVWLECMLVWNFFPCIFRSIRVWFFKVWYSLTM